MWPSKVVKYNEQTKEAEVRFFGTPHDKAWCSLSNCLMLNEMPGTGKVNKNQRNKLEAAINELKTHLDLLNQRFPNLFQFSPPKTTLTPDKIYLIPLPEAVTAPLTPSSISSSSAPSKEPSIVSESVASENSENINQPARKQQKTTAAAAAPAFAKSSAVPKAASKSTADEESASNENDQFSLNEDSDDDFDHKLVIDDESLNSTNKKRPPSKRKHQDSSSSSSVKVPALNKSLSAANQSVQKRKLSAIESPQLNLKNLKNDSLLKEASPVLPKKKLKKSANDSAANSSNSSLVSQNYQQQTPLATEKERQLFKQVQYYKDELERSRAIHISEIKEMFENHKSEFRDLKTTMEAEKMDALESLREELESEHAKAIEDAKRKTWCVQCLKQASYFCCRLASYCSYDCQSDHWATHMSTCLQSSKTPAAATTDDTAASNQEEPKDETLSKDDKAEQQPELTDKPVATDATESTREPEVEPAVEPAVELATKSDEEKPAKSPVKKIKQIIAEKNEQQNKHESQSAKPVEATAKIEVKESSKSEDKSIVKKSITEKPIEPAKEPIPEKPIVEKPTAEKPIVEQVVAKKPITEKPVEPTIEQAPGKPKDRFLKKLNEDKSNLIAEPIKHQPAVLPQKAAEDKSNLKTESSDKTLKKEDSPIAKIDEPIDKPANTSLASKEVEGEDKMEVDEIAVQPKGDESKAEKKNEEPHDELAKMREQLVQKLLENKKRKESLADPKNGSESGEQRKEPAEEKSEEAKPVEKKPAEEKPTEEKPVEEKPAEEKPAEKAPVKVSDSSDLKKKEAPVSQFSLERRVDVNLSEESDEEDEESKNEVRLEEASKRPVHEESLDDFEDDSNLMDELISDGLKKGGQTEEASNATPAEVKPEVKASEKQRSDVKADSSSSKDQLKNQNNEEISSSPAAPDQSPIQFEVNSVKEDLISKVESELSEASL